MHDLGGIILGFVLTVLIGNRLLQEWQHRTWIRQQQFLGQEKEYTALKQLSEELSAAMGARLYIMKRLLLALSSLPIDDVEKAVAEYRDVLTTWNNNLNSYYVRLALYANSGRTYALENVIQRRFYSMGQKLEALVRRRRNKSDLKKAELVDLSHAMNSMQREIFEFNRDILHTVEQTRRTVFFGEKIFYTRENLLRFSTYELIKALFVSDVNGHAVFRSSVNPSFPSRIR